MKKIKYIIAVCMFAVLGTACLESTYQEVDHTTDGSHCVFVHDVWGGHNRIRHEQTANGVETHSWTGLYCPKGK
jgi:hypothetical protein